MASLRRVVLQASLLSLVACGGAVADDGSGTSGKKTTVTDVPQVPPTPTTPPPTTTTPPNPPPPTTPSCDSQPWTFACTDDPTAVPLPDCAPFRDYVPPETCAKYCYGPSVTDACGRASTDRDADYLACRIELGSTVVRCAYELPGGRRPDAYQPLAASGAGEAGEVGRWLAGLAHLEAASVDAFCILAEELEEHGAPERLVAAARSAAADEVRHAKVVARLAAEHGAGVVPPARAVKRARTLLEVARENAVEGCVRETYGALVAMWQAEAAPDARFRRKMGAIAADEARHSALAWHVAQWAESRLSDAENAAVAEAKRAAEAELDREIEATPDTAAWRWLGLPSREEARRLREAFGDGLAIAA